MKNINIFRKFNKFLAILVLIPMILPPFAFAQVVAGGEARETRGRPPAISGFTVSALSGNIEAEVSFSSTGDGEIIQCEVMLGEVRGERLSIQNTRGGTICTGTFSVGRESYSLSDLSAYAVNSSDLEDLYTPARLKATPTSSVGDSVVAPNNRNNQDNQNNQNNNSQREQQENSNIEKASNNIETKIEDKRTK